jgi:3-dehydro-L-gulonate 2-dehydrogenase
MNQPNTNNYKEIFIPFEEMRSEFLSKLIKSGFSKDKAETLAEVFACNSLDGIYTHGVNRFARFIKYVRDKIIDTKAEPELTHNAGSIEQWDGNFAAGPLNALFSTGRAIEIAKQNGMGCVALSNTNHWMRPGYYGWQATRSGFCFIAWTNTIPIMPAWGSSESRIGNNPFVFAVPYGNDAIVLDSAVSQFSYGIMESYKMRNEKLPFDGGFDKNGNLTNDPSEILDSMRPLPIGYWKGAGMALLFDIFAAILSGGLSTHDIGRQGVETGISQVYIAFDISKLKNFPSIQQTIGNIIDDYLSSNLVNEKTKLYYPGQRVLERRTINSTNGIPVGKSIWDEIINL